MSWMSMNEMRDRIAQLQAISHGRDLTAAELDEFERLDFNYCQRLRRLTDQAHHARQKAQQLESTLAELRA